MFKVIIAGGRDFDNWEYNNCWLDKIDYYLKNKDPDKIEMVTGCAKGADQIPYFYNTWYGYSIKEFPADWNKYGKPAGYIRNKEMAEYSDALIAFWDGKSNGTKHMIDLAKKYDLNTRVLYY